MTRPSRSERARSKPKELYVPGEEPKRTRSQPRKPTHNDATKSKTTRSKSAPPPSRKTKSKSSFNVSDETKQVLDDNDIDFMERNIFRFSDSDKIIIIKLLKDKCPDAVIQGGSDNVEKKYARVMTGMKDEGKCGIPSDTPNGDIIIIDCNKMDMNSKIWLFKLQYTYNGGMRPGQRVNFEDGCLRTLNPTTDTIRMSYLIVMMSSTTEKLLLTDSYQTDKVRVLKACTTTDCYHCPQTTGNICGMCDLIGDRSGCKAREMLTRLYLKGVFNKEDFIQLVSFLLQQCPQVITDLGIYTQHAKLKNYEQNDGKVIMFNKIPSNVTSSIWEKMVDDLKFGRNKTFTKKQSFGEQNRLLPTTGDDVQNYYVQAQETINHLSVVVMVSNETHFGIMEVASWKAVLVYSRTGEIFFRHCSKTCMIQAHTGRCSSCAKGGLAERILELPKEKQLVAIELTSDKYYEQMADSILEWILSLPSNDEWRDKFINHLDSDEKYRNLPLKDAIIKACKSGSVGRCLPWQVLERASGEAAHSEPDEDELEETNEDEFKEGDGFESDDTLPSDAYETDGEADRALSSDIEVGQTVTRSTRTSKQRFVYDNEDDEENLEDEESSEDDGDNSN